MNDWFWKDTLRKKSIIAREIVWNSSRICSFWGEKKGKILSLLFEQLSELISIEELLEIKYG